MEFEEFMDRMQKFHLDWKTICRNGIDNKKFNFIEKNSLRGEC